MCKELVMERAKLDLPLGNWAGHVGEVTVDEPSGTRDHRTISFNIAMDKDWVCSQIKVPNWSKNNFDGVRQEFENFD